MKKGLFVILLLFFVSGCAGTVKKSFKVIAEPPDSDIKVISGKDLKEERYRTPAEITVKEPKDPVMAAKGVVEISRETYKPRKITIRSIKNGETINIKLEKILHFLLKYRLLNPVKADSIAFRDKIVSMSFTVEERAFQMNIENLSDYTIKILWDRAEYTDVSNRPHRLMHSGVRYQDRNNPIPPQTLPSQGSLQQAVMPATYVVYSQEKKAYENRQLFPLYSEIAAELKGRVFYLFIPIEIDRQIIPYNIKIEIADVIKE